jgi:hypothetical protein
METLGSCLGDLRHGGRSLRSSPGFAAIAVATLALGIGGVTALFSVVNGVLLSPLPFPEPDRIVRVWNSLAADPLDEIPLSLNEVFEYGARSRCFEAFSGFDYTRVNLTGADEPRRVLAARVQSDFFDVFAVPPALGRSFTAEEDRPGADDVVVLSHRLWYGAFGANRDVLGRRLELGGRTRTVVGVAAPELDYPRGVDVFLPMAIDGTQLDAETMLSHGASAIGRLADGIPLERGEEDLARVVRSLAEEYPDHFAEGDGARFIPLKETQVGDVLSEPCRSLGPAFADPGRLGRNSLAVVRRVTAGGGRDVEEGSAVEAERIGGAGFSSSRHTWIVKRSRAVSQRRVRTVAALTIAAPHLPVSVSQLG